MNGEVEKTVGAAGLVKLRGVLCLFVAVLLCFLVGSQTVFATEGGGGAYPNGAEDFMVGALPPPGTYFLNYMTYYTADEFKDGSGGNLFPNFDVDAFANVFRFIHVTKQQVLGASWAVHIFVPIVNVDVSTPGGDGSKFGLGDIIIDPFILGWHWKNFHITTGVDIYLPTGGFDKNRIANVGRNYWTFEPVAAFTYLSDGGFEVSAKFMYDFNTENTDTNYQSGQEFHFDYLVGMKFGSLSAGLNGYYYRQTTNDEVNNKKVEPEGLRGQAVALGPALKYDYKNMSFILKYQKEFDVEYKPEGDKFWFKFMYAF